jgi:hypothetical protein
MGTDEEIAMRRLTGSALAVVLVIAIGQEARAQSADPASGPGGFGLEYTQSVPSNSLVLDRWWMLEATPMVGSILPGPAVAQTEASTVQTTPAARAARPARSFSRTANRRLDRGVVPASASLPTGSLYWPAGVVPLYSPAQRYATYGQGYDVSPYGTIDYGAAYKGFYWGY